MPAYSQSGSSANAKRNADLMNAAEEFDKKLLSIENKFVSPALLNSDDQYFVEPYKLYLNLMWLNAEVGTGGGDVAGGADFPPTDTQMELLQGYESEISAADADYQKIVKEDLPVLNNLLEQGSELPVTVSSKANSHGESQ